MVFPARAGMSPVGRSFGRAVRCFPRPRGDEPGRNNAPKRRRPVFPARAGMSREAATTSTTSVRFPRPRGDEPSTLCYVLLVTWFSPPARG